MILILVNVSLLLKGNPLPVLSTFDFQVPLTQILRDPHLRQHTTVPELPVQPHLEFGVGCHPPSSCLLVLELGAAVTGFPDCSGGTVGDADAGVHFIDVLPAGSAASECLQVAVVHRDGQERFPVFVSFLHAEPDGFEPSVEVSAPTPV
jgi:hypothetical protein